MKKCLILIFIIIIISCKKKNEQVIERYGNGLPKIVDIDENGKKTRYQYYESQKKRSIVPLKDTVKHGKYTLWYEDGNIWAVGEYKDGIKHDTAKEFYTNGRLKKLQFYEKGQMLIYRRYDEEGRKKSEINGIDKSVKSWHKNGQLRNYIPNMNGEYFEYFNDGSVKLRGQIVNGKADGPEAHFDLDGKQTKSIIYKQDSIIDSVLFDISIR